MLHIFLCISWHLDTVAFPTYHFIRAWCYLVTFGGHSGISYREVFTSKKSVSCTIKSCKDRRMFMVHFMCVNIFTMCWWQLMWTKYLKGFYLITNCIKLKDDIINYTTYKESLLKWNIAVGSLFLKGELMTRSSIPSALMSSNWKQRWISLLTTRLSWIMSLKHCFSHIAALK